MVKKMDLPKRKTTRLSGYDYASENYYFITICAHEKACLFGTIKEKNFFGKIAEEELRGIDAHYAGVRVDKAIVMPNHIHAIIAIGCDNQDQNYPSLNTIVGQYKAGVTRRIRQLAPQKEVWQRSYHDRIIRNRAEYEKIWQYIDSNRQKWDADCFYVG